jgi:hypothetical protein
MRASNVFFSRSYKRVPCAINSSAPKPTFVVSSNSLYLSSLAMEREAFDPHSGRQSAEISFDANSP